MSSVLVIALIVASAAQAIAPSPNIETWKWDPKLPTCALKQQRPEGARGVTVERTPGGEETQVLVPLDPSLKFTDGSFLDAVLRTDAGLTFKADIFLGPDPEGRPQLYIDTPDPAFIDNLARTRTLTVSYGKNKTITVPIAVPAKVIASLRECEDASMRDWGIDPVVWRGLSSRPRPVEHVKGRFRDLDYPADALIANVEADAVVRLDVGPNGRVTNCRMINAGVAKAFEIASCRVLKGAKFAPATDGGGKPIEAPIVYDVRFRIRS